LANYDANVFIFDVDFQQGNGAIKSLLAQFPKANVKFKLCDISSWEAQERTFEEVFIEQGNINLVVANAGISERGSLLNLDGVKPCRPDLSTLSVNLTGTIYSEFDSLSV
jgi:short-subunit dehydrogenase